MGLGQALKKNSRLIVAFLAVSSIFAACVVLAVLYTDGMSGAIISIVASVLTPALGAMVTLIFVAPLRAIRKDTQEIREMSTEHGGKIAHVELLVDSRVASVTLELDEMRASTQKLLAIHGEVIEQLNRLQDSFALAMQHMPVASPPPSAPHVPGDV